jgi:Zn-dependent protease with chaperone function
VARTSAARRFWARVKLEVPEGRIRQLLQQVIRQMPAAGLEMPSLQRIVLVPHSPTPTLAAYTHYVRQEEVISTRGNHGRRRRVETQAIYLYEDLLGRLSEAGVKAVLVHELAHAWLNQHVQPEDSAEREAASDELARAWGFGNEIAVLEHETLPA